MVPLAPQVESRGFDILPAGGHYHLVQEILIQTGPFRVILDGIPSINTQRGAGAASRDVTIENHQILHPLTLHLMDYRFTAVAKHTGNPLGQTAEKLERLLLTHGQSPFLCLIGNGVIIMISQQIVNIISTKNKYWSSSAKICEQFTPISYGSVARQSCLRRKNGCSGCVVCWIFGRWF